MFRGRFGLDACVILISSFLLFQVQPVIAKLILPWFGGSAALWTTCLLFFQSVLVGGYLYAHWVVRLSPRWNAWVHVGLLAASVALLPIRPSEAWRPGAAGDPALRILLLLTVCVGLPYFLLSATSPLLQAWHARTHPKGAPYRLYALSNFGSLLGLLSYPVAVEPWMSGRWQAWVWSAAYVAFAILCAGAALKAARAEALPDTPDAKAAQRPGAGSRLLWMALPACASVLLLATTNHLTQNVAPVPFLWILPLALYLLSFILCFGSKLWYRSEPYQPIVIAALFTMAILALFPNLAVSLWVEIAVLAVSLFIVCMFCHGELAHHKPAPEFLTSFYVMMSLGGALGGMFVALAAPRIFTGYLEFPIGLAACALLGFILAWRRTAVQAAMWAAVFVVLCFLVVFDQKLSSSGAVAAFRNFYGPVRVVDEVSAGRRVRVLYHGSIIHGAEILGATGEPQPTTYYGPRSGGGVLLNQRSKSPLRIGLVGLGAGTLAAYGAPGDYYRFYEINPGIIDLARTRFDFIPRSPARIEFVAGDARLSLEREAPQGFDVLVVDAFSGDSIPAHLLDVEAFSLYLRHLSPDGTLALHLSNRFLDLGPMVAVLAEMRNLRAAEVLNGPEPSERISEARWVLVPRNPAILDTPPLAALARRLTGKPGLRPWTDDYSNLLSVLK
jgi:SAM-dependent methyltransferase